jgi:hypothetical protein
VSGHNASPNQVAHPTPGRAGPRSHSTANRKWSLHPMGGSCAVAQCFQHASNAQASATRRPGTDCDEPTRGAPDRCIKQGVPHSAVPPRRKRADGSLGERGRRPRTHRRPAPSAAAVTLAHERATGNLVPGRQHGGRAASRDSGLGADRASNPSRRHTCIESRCAGAMLALGRSGLDHLHAATHGYRDTLTCISEPICRRPATGDPEEHVRIAYRRLWSTGGAPAHSGPPVRLCGAALRRRWPGARSARRGQMVVTRLRRRVSKRRLPGGP